MASAAASRDGLSRGPGSTDRINISDSDSDSDDRRPSDLLRLIERILGRSIQWDDIATEEFIMRLPGQTQLIVHVCTG